MDIERQELEDDVARHEESGAEPAPPPGDPLAAASLQPGSGRWVESSWDLCRGLTVHEGLPADAALDEWIEAQLRN